MQQRIKVFANLQHFIQKEFFFVCINRNYSTSPRCVILQPWNITQTCEFLYPILKIEDQLYC